MIHPLRHLRFALGLALATAAMLAVGCDGDGPSSPTAPNATLTLTAASVSVDGAVLQSGDTFHARGAGSGVTRFEATLIGPFGPATGHLVEVRFERPQGMMNPRGAFRLYDDGTHGDRFPGDGVYCFEDPDGHFGFHHRQAFAGHYRYDFCGLYANGAETNHAVIDVDVVD